MTNNHIGLLLGKLIIDSDTYVECQIKISASGSTVSLTDGEVEVVYYTTSSKREPIPMSVTKLIPGAMFTHFYYAGNIGGVAYSRDEVAIDGIRLSIVVHPLMRTKYDRAAVSCARPTMLDMLDLSEPEWRVSKLFTADMVRAIKRANTYGSPITAIIFDDATICQVYGDRNITFKFVFENASLNSESITVRRSNDCPSGVGSFRFTTRSSNGSLVGAIIPLINALI